MKRDMELIRKILLALEASESFWASSSVKIEGYTEKQIGYNSYLLIDAGLVEGHSTPESNTEFPLTWINHLNWAGHEFLDAARNETRWKKVTRTLLEKGETVTIGVLQGLLVAAMKSAVGLP